MAKSNLLAVIVSPKRLNSSVVLSKIKPKKLSKTIRDSFPKAQASIQGDALRVTSKSKDELQAIIQLVKGEDFPLALQFTNYR